MISKTKDQKQTFWSRMDQLNIPEAQSMTDSLVEYQLMFKMTSETEGWILGSIWGLRESATYWINGLKNDGDEGCQYDYYTYEINHNESKQEIPYQ